jgi:hypothetical protein
MFLTVRDPVKGLTWKDVLTVVVDECERAAELRFGLYSLEACIV